MISIVTPSYNQAPFLDDAIRSVLSQGVDVEYVVIDGASTDGSVDVIRSHEAGLAAWVSESDGGQYDAINRGFGLTSGEIMGWLNSDDFYFPGCLSLVEDVFTQFPQIDWIAGTMSVMANTKGQTTKTIPVGRFSRAAFCRGFNLPMKEWHSGYFLPQESTFWRRSLWERAGGQLDESLRMAGDFDLWARFYDHAELWGVRALLGAYRTHPKQKTATGLDEYLAEAEQVLRRRAGRPYGRRETAARDWLASKVGNDIWRLPTHARRALEERGLVYRAPELIWHGQWMVSNLYFL